MEQQSVTRIGVWEALAFVTELAMLVALAVVGWRLAPGQVLGYVLVPLLPVVVAVVWAVWLAPRAVRRLPGSGARIGKIVVFVVTGALLWATGLWPWGVALAVLAVLAIVMSGRRSTT